MKPVSLHKVTYFKGEETRTISKHLRLNDALHYAGKFLDNIINRYEEKGETVIKAVTHSSSGNHDSHTTISLTRKDSSPLNEGMTIELQEQLHEHWDRSPHSSAFSSTDSGHITTAHGHSTDGFNKKR